MNEQLQRIVEIICLIYHEARGIWRPIRDGKLPRGPRYHMLLGLPEDRRHAWTTMADQREKAFRTGSAAGAARQFAEAFGLSLDDLHDLFLDDCWRDSGYGGRRWALISQRVNELVEAADTATGELVESITGEVLGMRHNSGTVGKKLQQLSTPGGKA